MKTEGYKLINQPFGETLDHSQFSGQDIQAYFNWFKEIKDERFAYFMEYVYGKSFSGISDINLLGLQYLLRDSLRVRRKTALEINDERSKLPDHLKRIHKIKEYVFVEPSYSMIFDVGLFWGELLRSKFSSLEWEIESRPEMAQYGELCLNRKGQKTFCPVWIVYTLSIQVYEKRASEDRLKNLHEFWLRILEKSQAE